MVIEKVWKEMQILEDAEYFDDYKRSIVERALRNQSQKPQPDPDVVAKKEAELKELDKKRDARNKQKDALRDAAAKANSDYKKVVQERYGFEKGR